VRAKVLSMFIPFIFIGCDPGNNSLNPDTTQPAATASYLLTFTSTWSAATHPLDFPPNPHFSGLVGATHNAQVSFWQEGQPASKGIKDMAERGLKDPLTAEIDSAILQNNAGAVLSGGGLAGSPDSVMLSFSISRDFPLITVVSMLAPSPDWFIGVTALPLFENNQWLEKIVVNLYAYDAGTDNGSTYTAPDEVSNPPEPITQIMEAPFLVNSTIPVIGTFTIVKQSQE